MLLHPDEWTVLLFSRAWQNQTQILSVVLECEEMLWKKSRCFRKMNQSQSSLRMLTANTDFSFANQMWVCFIICHSPLTFSVLFYLSHTKVLRKQADNCCDYCMCHKEEWCPLPGASSEIISLRVHQIKSLQGIMVIKWITAFQTP